MIIAYDLRYASDHFTGIGTHAYRLLEALLELPGEERYAVLWNPSLANRRFDLAPIRNHPRVTWVERAWSPLAWTSLWKIGGWLRQLRPALYLSPFYFLPFSAHCPCVLTLHDVWPVRLPGGLRFIPRTMYQLAIARASQADVILTSSEFSRKEIEELTAAEPGQVQVVMLGIAPLRTQQELRRPDGLPSGPFALVVGINKPHKNLTTLVSAWAALEGPPLYLVSAGPEDDRHESVATLAKRSGAKGVVALGRVSESELEWLYGNAEMVVFPSFYEGFGLPAVEAFAHGVPVVASDIPTLREVGDGVAMFVEARNPSAWAAAVRRLHGDPELRKTMTEAGRTRAGELTYERTARHTLEILRGLARRGSRP